MLVEGKTEQGFCLKLLAPHFGTTGFGLNPRIIGKPGQKGGIRSFSRVIPELTALAKQEPNCIITTMFDYYALPSNWPGLSESKSREHEDKPAIIEKPCILSL